ncbi:MAG: molybdopterin molybdotransferase MoeA [Gammaproteobacteria bacterium]|nr:molybdopterin molybdotransferase MoeA [Gammaproteobacteria bacterium]
MKTMLNVDLAFQKLGDLVRRVNETERVAINDAIGRIAAESVEAPVDLPPFDASAMDGYAVDATGLDHSNKKRFDVIDESLAGRPAARALGTPQHAIRVFTGAAIPAGANAVVLQEDAVRQGATMITGAPIHRDQHVRHRGHDVKRGSRLCCRGTRLSHFHLSWFAACGIEEVVVARRIRVGVFSTGDELAERGTPLKAGQIYDSNRFAIASLLREKAVETFDLGCIPDDQQMIADSLGKAAKNTDLLLTSGGVSVGDADYVKEAVDTIGRIEFWNIALKPGKPLAIGRVGNALFFGLPGNPVSAIVTYLLFVAPTIDRLGGREPTPPLTLAATMNGRVRHSAGRREYLRGTLQSFDGQLVVTPTGDQGSNRLASFAGANCLVVVNENKRDVEDGESVDVILLPDEGAHLMRS